MPPTKTLPPRRKVVNPDRKVAWTYAPLNYEIKKRLVIKGQDGRWWCQQEKAWYLPEAIFDTKVKALEAALASCTACIWDMKSFRHRLIAQLVLARQERDS